MKLIVLSNLSEEYIIDDVISNKKCKFKRKKREMRTCIKNINEIVSKFSSQGNIDFLEQFDERVDVLLEYLKDKQPDYSLAIIGITMKELHYKNQGLNNIIKVGFFHSFKINVNNNATYNLDNNVKTIYSICRVITKRKIIKTADIIKFNKFINNNIFKNK